MVLRQEKHASPEREAQLLVVRAAFTLMEMLVVVAIIVSLAGIGGYYFLNTLESSKKKTAKVQITSVLTTAVGQYQMDHGQPPPSLEALLQRDSSGGPYLKTRDALLDPWGQPYRYNQSGQNQDTGEQEPEITTQAPDGTLISNLHR